MRRAWIFPGQGAQVVGMASDLIERYPSARDTMAEADEALGFALSELMAEGPMEQLTMTANTQPAILTHSVMVARLLREAGVDEPVAVAGHSLGEYSALVASGAMGFADALRSVNARGRFMQDAVPAGLGAMSAVIGLAADAVEAVCAEHSSDEALVRPANFNDPKQTVIAGHASAVAGVADALKAAGARRVLPLPVSAPFHCPLMAPVQPRLREVLDGITVKDPTVPVISNVEAQPNADGGRVVDLLVEQVCAPVRWVDCVGAIEADEALELGPGRALAGMVRRINKSLPVTSIGTADQLSAFLES